MVSLGDFPSSGRFGPHESTLKRIATSKLVRAVVAVALLVGIAFSFVAFRETIGLSNDVAKVQDAALEGAGLIAGAIQSSGKNEAVHPNKGRLHLLIPATSSNVDLCKLVLSAQILGYPTPVFINFGDAEEEDAYIQHLAKVEGILSYLDQLETNSEYGEDLVFIVDGYDLWLQLRPDVLVKRYYAINQEADALTEAQFGTDLFHEHDMRQTIIFGPDKICWPIDFSRPACWAVPQAHLPRYAFGPRTAGNNEEQHMPKWLNSGTILGPVQDLRDLFRDTLELIHVNHVTDSDQYYFAELFGAQNYARLTHKQSLLNEYKKVRYGDEIGDMSVEVIRDEPDIPLETDKTEYHIGIDYKSSIFQTLAFWKQYLAWMRPIDSVKIRGLLGDLNYTNLAGNPYEFDLPEDIQKSARPFEALQRSDPEGNHDVGWEEVELLYNAITKEAPVAMHFTGEKGLRQIWWQRIWFQADANALRLASSRQSSDAISDEPIAGMVWYNAEPEDAEEISMRGKTGAWSDTGGWYPWRKLCRAYEEHMFNVPDDEFFHHDGVVHPLPQPEG